MERSAATRVAAAGRHKPLEGLAYICTHRVRMGWMSSITAHAFASPIPKGWLGSFRAGRAPSYCAMNVIGSTEPSDAANYTRAERGK